MEGAASSRNTNQRSVMLLPFPAQGHLNPMFHLGALLHSRGFAVTIIHTTLNAPDPTKHPHFRFHQIAESLPADTPAMDDDVVSFILALNASLPAPLTDSLLTMPTANPTPTAASCLIIDSLMFSAREVARRLGLPTIALRTGSATCFRIYSAFTLLFQNNNENNINSRSDAVVPELPPFRWKDLPYFEMSSPHDACLVISQMVKNVGSARALVLNTFEELEPNEIRTIAEELQQKLPVFAVGPLHKLSPSDHTTHDLLVQDHTCIDWLDRKARGSVLYVSFGSLARISEDELLEIAWGLASSGQNFLWVLRPGSVLPGSVAALMDEQSSFTEETRERGKVVEWAPQGDVLRHPSVGGFWTHCGWNSTLESVCEGVPMLCWPYFADQMLNARVVDHVWKVGITVDAKLERDAIEKAVRRLMEGGEGREMKRRAEDLKAKAALCMDVNGGSSIRTMDKLVDFISSLTNN